MYLLVTTFNSASSRTKCLTNHIQSVTNYFIANLALADVIIGLFAIPFQVTSITFSIFLFMNKIYFHPVNQGFNYLLQFQAALLQRWNLPPFLCPFCPFFQVASRCFYFFISFVLEGYIFTFLILNNFNTFDEKYSINYKICIKIMNFNLQFKFDLFHVVKANPRKYAETLGWIRTFPLQS